MTVSTETCSQECHLVGNFFFGIVTEASECNTYEHLFKGEQDFSLVYLEIFVSNLFMLYVFHFVLLSHSFVVVLLALITDFHRTGALRIQNLIAVCIILTIFEILSHGVAGRLC
jgi:hypothetical protein